MYAFATLKAAVDTLGIPRATFEWPHGRAPELPYVVLVPTESRNQLADDHVIARARAWDAELYMRSLDMGLVVRLENALDAAGIAYSSDIHKDEENRYCLARFMTTIRE